MNHSIAHHHQDSDLFGLLYGFRFRHGESGQEIGSAAALDYLQNPPEENGFIWLHLNLSHAACERWMKAQLDLPEEFFEALHEGSRSTRIEHVDTTLLAVVNDVVFDFNRLSTDISTLWVCARQRLLITARLQPLRSVDKLRSAVKRGEQFDSPLELLAHLLSDQGEVLTQFLRKTSVNVDRIEDQLLSQRLSNNRSELGAMRRVLVRLQRLLALEPGDSGPALKRLAASLPRPRAIVMVSAHWESHELIVNGNPQPETWHDFGGFPPELFAVQYPAQGLPELTRTAVDLLAASDLPARIDSRRPFDHGVWVPLSLMYPNADIPVVQVSLPSRQGPELQTRVGRALASLREQGVLIIGSGSITHNLRDLDWNAGPDSIEPWAAAFRDWMIDKLQNDDEAALHHYRSLAPHAARAHPSDEHLLPLYFARGAGGVFGIAHQGFTMGALGMDIYRFG